MRFLAASVAVLAVALFGLPTLADSGHAHHHDAAETTGEPGDPQKTSRSVEIAMRETQDGRMVFEPASVTVAKGEQIRFVLRNEGALDHEFILATRAENDRHAVAMRENPDMAHDEPNGRRLAPGGRAEIVWRFANSGAFNFSCLIPGHREAGMDGDVAVK